MKDTIELIDRLVYVSLIGMSCVVVGRFIQKVVYPWAKNDWNYWNDYELLRRKQLSQFQSQLTKLLDFMDESLRETYKIHIDFRQVWNRYLEMVTLYRQDLDQIEKECVWIRSFTRKLSDISHSCLLLNHPNQPAAAIGNEYERDILECELKSLRGLLMNRLYFSPNKNI
jgi:hypothetical protein